MRGVVCDGCSDCSRLRRKKRRERAALLSGMETIMALENRGLPRQIIYLLLALIGLLAFLSFLAKHNI